MKLFNKQAFVFIILVSAFVTIFVDYGSILLIRFIRKFKWKIIKWIKKGVIR